MNFRYFTIGELTESATARRYNIKNIPGSSELANLKALVENLLDPLRELLGRPVFVSSGYRCRALNNKVGGSKTSQHMKGQAADIYLKGLSNIVIAKVLVASCLQWDQCIIEKGSMQSPQWIHLSYKTSGNRHQILFYNGRSYVTVTKEQIKKA